jgi:hypothetical protein
LCDMVGVVTAIIFSVATLFRVAQQIPPGWVITTPKGFKNLKV